MNMTTNNTAKLTAFQTKVLAEIGDRYTDLHEIAYATGKGYSVKHKQAVNRALAKLEALGLISYTPRTVVDGIESVSGYRRTF